MLDDVWPILREAVLDADPPPRMFNPYKQVNEEVDRPEAPAIRRKNLKRYFSAYPETPPLFLLAEAPGPWGCRFSGIPITSESQLLNPDFPLSGNRSGTREMPHKESSATIHWRVLKPYFPQFFTWNTVPFHPHEAGAPMSIRNPGRRELREYYEVLSAILEAIDPQRVIAIGRKAERALNEMERPCTYVRHPSHGGATKFEAGVLRVIDEMGLEQTPAAALNSS